MKILITNDDGINSIGLHMLVKELELEHEIIVVAPDNQRSACGHSITITRPILVKEVKLEGISSRCFTVDGTPADCVKIAIEKLQEDKFDFVLSGINNGFNLGTDVIYSGTVSAAIESSIYKIPSIAISGDFNCTEEELKVAAEYGKTILKIAKENFIGNDIVLNINVPRISKDKIKGIKVCKLGNRIYTNCYIETLMDDKSIGFQLKGEAVDEEKDEVDVYNIKKGFVTLTPLHYDLTNFKIIKDVENWF
ncbi:stationary phase survival protein SurE [Fervidicella metallireducens AeB]|uniref:5'-nucleotidase SurE n=1 Tax=Fervidicella metallireducens AeB TaxID=1403537 RepID=A0A017RUW0_9CLOT|nr:5'/3'-nucleotidase SurE [Fervidicella metallireducens]EYE88401.1 stationary phase survival protein SurE [Fervidicella metallireducens AeB]